MKLIRSTFWLGMAFMLIGPHVDLNRSASDFTENSIAANEQFLREALNKAPCSSLECYGTKAALSVGLAQLSEQAHEISGATHNEIMPNSPLGDTPFPQPRLIRKG